MNWFERIKQKLSYLKVQQLERNSRPHRDFVDIERAHKVGLILNAGSCTADEMRTFRQYMEDLKRQRKQVYVVEINFNKKSESQFSHSAESVFLNPARLNWLDFPRQDAEIQIRNLDLDVLIDLDPSDRMTSRYVCSLSKARTRAGRHREGLESCYELMIDGKNPLGIPRMIETYTHFLSMIEK